MLSRISSQSGSALSHLSGEPMDVDAHNLMDELKQQTANLSSLQIFNSFLRANAAQIESDMGKLESDALYKAFYHARWFHQLRLEQVPTQFKNMIKAAKR